MTAPYYQRDGISIWHGDCRDVCENLPERSVDLLLTDPPYGMAWHGDSGGGMAIASDGGRQGMRTVRGMLASARSALSDGAHALFFCHWQSWPDFYDAVSPYGTVRNALIWRKNTMGTGNFEAQWASDYEVILFVSRGRPLIGARDRAVLLGHDAVPPTKRVHPTEKPVSLLRYLIGKSCPPGGLVADPFMGGGSTLVACAEMGVRGVGVEIEERYCEAAAKRVDAALDQGAIFARPLVAEATQGVL